MSTKLSDLDKFDCYALSGADITAFGFAVPRYNVVTISGQN